MQRGLLSAFGHEGLRIFTVWLGASPSVGLTTRCSGLASLAAELGIVRRLAPGVDARAPISQELFRHSIVYGGVMSIREIATDPTLWQPILLLKVLLSVNAGALLLLWLHFMLRMGCASSLRRMLGVQIFGVLSLTPAVFATALSHSLFNLNLISSLFSGGRGPFGGPSPRDFATFSGPIFGSALTLVSLVLWGILIVRASREPSLTASHRAA